MYAVIEAGGKQFRVAPGDVIRVDTIAGEKGGEVEFGRVIAMSRDNGDFVSGAGLGEVRVKGTIQSHGRGDKVLVFKFKRKKQYRRTIGHRQNFTEVRIGEILA